MARITASLYTSHIPAVGAAFDHGRTKEDYWKPVFAGYDFDKEWMKTHTPDVIFLVYNDHATAFSLQFIPTFAIMTGPEFNPADEGYGARPVPKVIGDPELASHIASEVIQQDFDLTMVNEIDVDHGLTVPLTCVFGKVDAWPCKVIPSPSTSSSTPCRRGRAASPSARRSAGRSGAIRRISTSRSGGPAA